MWNYFAFFQNLLNRHGHLEDEIKAYEADIERLKQLATLMTKAENLHNVSVTASFLNCLPL